MSVRASRTLGVSGVVVAVSAVLTSAALSSDTTASHPLHFGLVKSLTERSPAAGQLLSRLFAALIKQQTGLDAEAGVAGDFCALAGFLEKKKYELGFFYGVEFAWAEKEYPALRPLVTVSKYRSWQARLVVPKDSPAMDLLGLKAKDLAFPKRHRPHCRLFLAKQCVRQGAENPKAFFRHITYPSSTEDALDSLLSGEVQGAIVDNSALDEYRDIKPGCFARLRVIAESEPFPPSVIVYRAGALDEAICTRLRNGLMNANKSDTSREIMALCGVTAFQIVPADFHRQMAEIRKAYPSPVHGSRAGNDSTAP